MHRTALSSRSRAADPAGAEMGRRILSPHEEHSRVKGVLMMANVRLHLSVRNRSTCKLNLPDVTEGKRRDSSARTESVTVSTPGLGEALEMNSLTTGRTGFEARERFRRGRKGVRVGRVLGREVVARMREGLGQS